jgi:hypothetical protein
MGRAGQGSCYVRDRTEDFSYELAQGCTLTLRHMSRHWTALARGRTFSYLAGQNHGVMEQRIGDGGRADYLADRQLYRVAVC